MGNKQKSVTKIILPPKVEKEGGSKKNVETTPTPSESANQSYAEDPFAEPYEEISSGRKRARSSDTFDGVPEKKKSKKEKKKEKVNYVIDSDEDLPIVKPKKKKK